MRIGLPLPAQRISITTEYDVIVMRQEVRQVARALGMGLAEQAKIATAISAIARAILARHRGAVFVLQTTGQQVQAMLEIDCLLGSAPVGDGKLEQIWNLADLRLLVDEVIVLCEAGETILRIRMRLTHTGQR